PRNRFAEEWCRFFCRQGRTDTNLPANLQLPTGLTTGEISTFSEAVTMSHTSFDPVKHGFHFPNTFVNHVIFNYETRGLCGGMAFAALDYFYAGLPVPTHTPGDFGAGNTSPPPGARLHDYIFERMIDSLFENLGTWARVYLDPFFDPVRHTKRKLPELLGTLDLGRPVPLGLIFNRNLAQFGLSHQLDAVGYDLSANGDSLTLFLYDNRLPDETLTLTTNPNDPQTIVDSRGGHWIGFFMEDYSPNRPTYIDLGLST